MLLAVSGFDLGAGQHLQKRQQMMRNSIKNKSRWEKFTAVCTETLWIENLERDSENTKTGQTNSTRTSRVFLNHVL